MANMISATQRKRTWSLLKKENTILSKESKYNMEMHKFIVLKRRQREEKEKKAAELRRDEMEQRDEVREINTCVKHIVRHPNFHNAIFLHPHQHVLNIMSSLDQQA